MDSLQFSQVKFDWVVGKCWKDFKRTYAHQNKNIFNNIESTFYSSIYVDFERKQIFERCPRLENMSFKKNNTMRRNETKFVTEKWLNLYKKNNTFGVSKFGVKVSLANNNIDKLLIKTQKVVQKIFETNTTW